MLFSLRELVKKRANVLKSGSDVSVSLLLGSWEEILNRAELSGLSIGPQGLKENTLRLSCGSLEEAARVRLFKSRIIDECNKVLLKNGTKVSDILIETRA